jgi:hypothetical protein
MKVDAIVIGRNDNIKGTSYVGSVTFSISVNTEEYEATKSFCQGNLQLLSSDKDLVDSFKIDKVYTLNIE